MNPDLLIELLRDVGSPHNLATASLTEATAMSNMTLKERIRARAYELSQQDGALEGCADEYWRMARVLVEKETAIPDGAQKVEPVAQAE